MTKKGKKLIKGHIKLVPNPCLTEPCLPGIVPALQTEKGMFYLYFEGNLLLENVPGKGFKPEVGDYVRIKGKVSKKRDIKGEDFKLIEIDSVKKLDKPKDCKE